MAEPRRSVLAALCAAVLLALTTSGPAPAAPRPISVYHAPRSLPTKGVVELLHGGGWFLVGPQARASMAPEVNWLVDRGYGVVNTDYSAGAGGLRDAVAVFDRIRASFGPRMPVCIAGDSAGGTWALLVAAERGSDVACATVRAAPTDCLAAADPIRSLCAANFGDRAEQASFSPACRVAGIHSPVMLAAAVNDPVVAPSQMAIMKDLLPDAATVLLREPGRSMFVHSDVNAGELNRYLLRDDSFLARSMARWRATATHHAAVTRKGRAGEARTREGRRSGAPHPCPSSDGGAT